MSKENLKVEETVSRVEYDQVLTELEEIKSNLPKEPSQEEVELQEKRQELFNKIVEFELKSNGLEAFKDVIHVADEEGLQDTIKTLKQIVNQIKIDSGYVPTDHAKNNEYENAYNKGDTVGMISNKLSKLFK